MKTDELIEALTGDLAPVRRGAVGLRIAAAAAGGGAVALALVLAWLGLRPDLAQAAGGTMFWMKAAYAVVLALAGFWCAERRARPVGSPRAAVTLAGAALAAMAVIGLVRLLQAPPSERMGMWLGGSWQRCPIYILVLSVPTLALALLALRRLAPTRLRPAGAAAGLFAGGVAAAAYGLHCVEGSAAFLATWYTLGMALSAALGGLLGPWALRWR